MAISIQKLALLEKKCKMQEMRDEIESGTSDPIINKDLRQRIVELMLRAGVTLT
ncbi:MAG: hypothetical protein MJ230_04035 [bacterium]|nr:hypothetical protein [bacterium]